MIGRSVRRVVGKVRRGSSAGGLAAQLRDAQARADRLEHLVGVLNHEVHLFRGAVEAQQHRELGLRQQLDVLDRFAQRRHSDLWELLANTNKDQWDLSVEVRETVLRLEAAVAQQHGDSWKQRETLHRDSWDQRLQLHADQLSIADNRLASLGDQLAGFHRDSWDAQRKLHDTLLRRLADVERAVRRAGAIAFPLPEVEELRAVTSAYLEDGAGVVAALPVEAADAPFKTVRSDVGELAILAHDTVIAPYVEEHGVWEREIGDLLRSSVRPGWTVVDVGAHVGYFTVMAASLAGPTGRVVAIEADPNNAACLQRNIDALAPSALGLWCAALERDGRVVLSRSPEANTGDSRAYDWAVSGDTVEVLGVRLDDIWPSEQRVDLVKIDLQGTDQQALAGFARTLEKWLPIVVLEFWPEAIEEHGDDPLEVLALYAGWGYRWSALDDPSVDAATDAAEVIRKCRLQPSGFLNLILRPAESD